MQQLLKKTKQTNIHLSSFSLCVTCTANLVKCTLGFPIFLMIELCSSSPLGEADKWQRQLITHPLVYLGLSLHATLQVHSVAICHAVCLRSISMYTNVCECRECEPRSPTKGRSLKVVVSAWQVIMIPSSRCSNYSWNKTHSPSWEKMKVSCYFLVSPPFSIPVSDGICVLFLIPPSPFLSFECVPIFLYYLFFAYFTFEKVITLQQKQSFPIPTNTDSKTRMCAVTREPVNAHTVIKPSGYQTSWLRPPWGQGSENTFAMASCVCACSKCAYACMCMCSIRYGA